VVDVGGGEEVAGERGGEFCADALGLESLTLFSGVEWAEAGMIAMAKHAALASVGVGETAEIAIVSVGTLVHERTPSDFRIATSRSRTELAVAVRKAPRPSRGATE